MIKSWHNPREVIVHQVPPEPEDKKRLQRLVALLATGIERLLTARSENEASTLLDFTSGILPNTTNVNDPAKTENE